MYIMDEVIEILMDAEGLKKRYYNDFTIGGCFDKTEFIMIVIGLTNDNTIGEEKPNEEGFILYDDSDIDTIIDHIN